MQMEGHFLRSSRSSNALRIVSSSWFRVGLIPASTGVTASMSNAREKGVSPIDL